MTLRLRVKVLLHVRLYDFYDMTMMKSFIDSFFVCLFGYQQSVFSLSASGSFV